MSVYARLKSRADQVRWDSWSRRKVYDRPHLETYYRIRARNLQWMVDRARGCLPAIPAPRILKTDLWNEAKKQERFFLDLDGRRVGVELAPGVCRRAASRHPGVFSAVNGSVLDLPFSDGSFDLVLDISTIDHCEVPGQVVQEYARILRPGGVLLLVAENPLCASYPVTKLQSLVGLHVPFYGFLPSLVRRVCRAAGLEILDSFKTNVHLPTVIVYPLERAGRLEAINRGRHPLWNLCKKYFVVIARKGS